MSDSLPYYVILDFETTGLDPTSAEIIEIGAILVEGLEEKDRFHALVKPTGKLPRVITQLTGITDEMLASEKPLAEVLPAFLEFMRDYPVVAHNASLEQNFLDHHVVPLAAGGAFMVHNSIEPLAMILPDHVSHSMDSMRKWARVSSENAHRADKDCDDLLKVLVCGFEFLKAERPHIAKLVDENLASDWWWAQFFRAAVGDSMTGAQMPERELLGDLRDLRSKDSSREIDWDRAVTAEQVHEDLHHSAGEIAFEFRTAQERMAQEVRQALIKGERIAIEAPTGTGKSVAYLLPGILAAEATQAPLVVSTHSKSLQDQLLEKDIPIVRALIGKPALRATTVKGQENYLCLRKFHDLVATFDRESLEQRWSLTYLQAYESVTPVAELDRISQYIRMQFPVMNMMIDRIRSHHTTTLGPPCPYYKHCHFFDSARLAHQSDVVIANHALVFQWPQNLPQIRNVVFDEAHHLEEQITEAYSVRLSEEEISENTDRFSRKSGGKRAGDGTIIGRLMAQLVLQPPFEDVVAAEKIKEIGERIRERLTDLRSVVPLALDRQREGSEGYEQMIDLANKKTPALTELLDALTNLAGALGDARAYLAAGQTACSGQKPKGGMGDDPALDLLNTYAFRFETYEQRVRALIDSGNDNVLRLLFWDGRESVWRLWVAPIEVAGLSEPFFASKRAVVLTSATLSSGSLPDFVVRRIGLNLSRPLLSLPSPYELEKQAVVYIPQDLAPPGTQSHLESLIDFTGQVASALGGRTLLLMTSNRRLRFAADALRERMLKNGITVLDSLSDRRAADVFRVTERALLIGSERYGEGLDIPGEALTCVIIEKINEAMTRSPLAEARKARTQFGLYDYDFPLRMMWLKQRAGRLIRSPSDTGAIVVFDSRYHAWSVSSRAHVNRALAPIPIKGGTREQIVGMIEAGFGRD